MSRPIPDNPLLLLASLAQYISGDDRYQEDGPLPKALRKELEEAWSGLSNRIKAAVAAKAAAREAVQSRDEFLVGATDVARRVRDAVYGIHGKRDQRIGDYGLSTPVKRQKKSKDDDSAPSKATG